MPVIVPASHEGREENVRKSCISLAFLFVALVLASNARAADVYVMRGLAAFLFPNVMYPLAGEIRKRGHNVDMTSYQAANRIVREITEKKRKRPGTKIALVGHSLGGNAVTSILQALAKEGIKIEYAAVIDAPDPRPIAPAVGIVDNFYQFDGSRKPVLVAQDRRKTQINQYNFRGKRGEDGGPGAMKDKKGHLSIATDPFVTSRIMMMIDRLGK